MKKACRAVLIAFLLVALCAGSAACGRNPARPADAAPEVTHTETCLLRGERDETPVHTFASGREGPTILIVGGTHGDEVGAWTAALELVSIFEDPSRRRGDMCGTVVIVPLFNRHAADRRKRYCKSWDGVPYSDLNRSFQLGRSNKAADATIRLSDAMIDLADELQPDYLIDMHESIASYTVSRYLGDSTVSNNRYGFIEAMLARYNENYREEGEVEFTNQPAVKEGSFCYHFSETYPDKVVFTIETNRKLVEDEDGKERDTCPLETRKRQQLNILNAMFDLAWDPAFDEWA